MNIKKTKVFLLITAALIAACGESEAEKEARELKAAQLERIQSNLNRQFTYAKIADGEHEARRRIEKKRQNLINSRPELAKKIKEIEITDLNTK